jgi:hypothetical protein
MAFPTEATASDSISWTYPYVSGETAKAVFQHIKTGYIISVDGSVSGSNFQFDLVPTDTAEAPSGIYSTAVIVTLAGVKETRKIGTLRLAAPIDRPYQESHARKMVRLLERHLEGRIDDNEGRGLESYTIGGVPISKLSHLDAKSLLDGYRRDVAAEEVQRRSDLGLGSGRRVLTNFDAL